MNKFVTFLAAGFFCFILWVIYLANTGQPNVLFQLVKMIPYGDKVGHLLLFGTLTLLANLALGFRVLSVNRLPLYWGTALVTVFVAIEELSQHFIPSRTLDMLDFIADIIGILLFTGLSKLLANHLRGSATDNRAH
ncbi:VanZ family protein [Ferrimonas aestuarii]|uniref:Trypsin n=1 Tax=Ferrimonas aestuarii TaxID=2569539 RepID=A0A4U1BDJ9_9GAMM|nr:VanZ family protein [Ferrimonas aestuarii]TKB49171.1 trypsin [Ferrimonas aestuarii]